MDEDQIVTLNNLLFSMVATVLEPYINILTHTKDSSSETSDLEILTYFVTMRAPARPTEILARVEKGKLGFKSHNQGMSG